MAQGGDLQAIDQEHPDFGLGPRRARQVLAPPLSPAAIKGDGASTSTGAPGHAVPSLQPGSGANNSLVTDPQDG